jgi:RND family efflux transporter MFP subunit
MVFMSLGYPMVARMKSWGFIAAILCTAGVTGCKPPVAKDPRTQTQQVEIAEVQTADAGLRGFTGVVTARVQSDLGFRVPGKITERLVDTGQSVRAGQPLMRIDRTDYAHAVSAQMGNVAAARARYIQAAADATRYAALVSSGAVSKSAYDQAKATADSARALLIAAEAQLKVARDEGQYSTLAADADGTVVETLAEPGQYVAAGQIVLRLARAGPREATVHLPETLRPAIGSVAEASLYGVPWRSTARLRQLSDAADPVTRTYEARYVLDGPAARAPLGATATLYLGSAEPATQLAVPLGAIDDEGRGPGVWVLNRKTSSVSFRPVQVLRLESERVILSGGLTPGSVIVALGGHFLHEGEAVRVAATEAPLQ